MAVQAFMTWQRCWLIRGKPSKSTKLSLYLWLDAIRVKMDNGRRDEEQAELAQQRGKKVVSLPGRVLVRRPFC